MTIEVGHYAIWTGGYRPVIVTITAVTDKTVRFKEGNFRERRGDKHAVKAHGADREKLEKAIERMISASSEGARRQIAASEYVRTEHNRIIQEAMA